MGVWHTKVPLSRFQDPSQLQGGCPRAVPDLWPPGAEGKEKRFSMRSWVERKKTVGRGNLWVIRIPNTDNKEWKNIQNSFGTCWICSAESCGWDVRFVGSGVNRGYPALIVTKSHRKKQTETTSICLILPATPTQLLTSSLYDLIENKWNLFLL